jgi:hypothetical protein
MSAMVVVERNANINEYTSVYREDGSVSRVSHNESVYITEEIPVHDEAQLNVMFNVTKAKEDKCLVSGWANVSVNADGSIPLDWQDDIIPPEVLEKAAIDFMFDYRESGEMHKGKAKGVVVESIVFTKEKQECIGIPEGTVPQGWFITVKVLDPEVFAKVKDGTYKMFSIQGKLKRVKL